MSDKSQHNVTAKVYLARKVETPGVPDVVLDFAPDYNDGRNKAWATFTPALSLTMTVKASVAKQFTTGGYYTLTFTETVEDASTTEVTGDSITETAVNPPKPSDTRKGGVERG